MMNSSQLSSNPLSTSSPAAKPDTKDFDTNTVVTGASDDDTCQSRIPQTTAFTVHFDNDKFTKRHIRNLSLPISKLYDGKLNCDYSKTAVNGKTPEGMKSSAGTGSGSVLGSAISKSSRCGKAAGNHSEGYFSSDAEDDAAHPKMFVAKLHTSSKKVSKPTNLAKDSKAEGERKIVTLAIKDEVAAEEEEEGASSDGVSEVSETGTYTIDKEKDKHNVEVITARLNIDNAFGVNQQTTTSTNDEPNSFDSAHSSLSWVNDWATQVVEHNSLTGVHQHDSTTTLPTAIVSPSPQQKQTNLSSQGGAVSKIPSPISTVRAQFRLTGGAGLTQPSVVNEYNNTSLTKQSPRARRSTSQCPTTTKRQSQRDEYSDSSLETESFLLATERVVSAMAARVSLSMDSGGESDVDTSHSCNNKRQQNCSTAVTPASVVGTPAGAAIQSDSSASESGGGGGGGGTRKTPALTPTSTCSITTPTTTTRYNRAFSLRRGRLDDPSKKDTKTLLTAGGGSGTTATSEAVSNKTKVNVESGRHLTQSSSVLSNVGNRLSKSSSTTIGSRTGPVVAHPPVATVNRSQSFSRTDCGRYSMRNIKTNQTNSPVLSNQSKNDVLKKKQSGARSNSTLSSREVEFQNWKRRKSYDPMKAAAEGKKKEAAKKQLQTTGITSAATRQKSSANPVLRSASFHGTRQLTVPSSSEEDDDGEEEEEEEEEEEVVPSAEEYEEEEDWTTPAAPRTSLESTPRGSRVSLYSNTSNSSLRSRPKLEGVDNLVISALSGLSGKVKVGSCNLLRKLRYLYDEDSPKAHLLTTEIEQLEASEPGSPHHTAVTNVSTNSNNTRSPSRELSTALRNLKRIESVIKALDNVLFDNEDFH